MILSMLVTDSSSVSMMRISSRYSCVDSADITIIRMCSRRLSQNVQQVLHLCIKVILPGCIIQQCAVCHRSALQNLYIITFQELAAHQLCKHMDGI